MPKHFEPAKWEPQKPLRPPHYHDIYIALGEVRAWIVRKLRGEH